MALILISKAFADAEPIPEKYALEGKNMFPPLAWGGAPEDTRSFALIVEDPDAPSGTFRHCGIANIPARWTSLAESIDTSQEGALRFYQNDFGNARYDGPQPPDGDPPHRYIFRIAALDVPRLTLPEAVGVEAMWTQAQKHTLAEASLTGLYQA
ncbi:YbhB/YbcL family Raf kinase inhibitor-like protein [Rhizobium sp. P38BS-XIX]|uniref:YbhB/YbcL family Raf kinase inhibitor-like protein n=1 Tax=Rhizobium sp. P38BS-XIX TaxID=2726740 RepID=UPI00145674F1|nr:YbhB/YbcL family Raf kinase inhibitor-like protein [Rhizobium sp. P38BS-XIX]NLS01036.1 YbhB/YbcL family Raf kinase inhibitor-like protein [Rhizobium sp. P38BS-XIX]